MKFVTASIAVALWSVSVSVALGANAHYVPEEGFVPNEKTAIAIAQAVWAPIYGERQIRHEAPFHATLKNGVWTVRSSGPPPGYFGGSAIAQITKRDGRVLVVSHER